MQISCTVKYDIGIDSTGSKDDYNLEEESLLSRNHP